MRPDQILQTAIAVMRSSRNTVKVLMRFALVLLSLYLFVPAQANYFFDGWAPTNNVQQSSVSTGEVVTSQAPPVLVAPPRTEPARPAGFTIPYISTNNRLMGGDRKVFINTCGTNFSFGSFGRNGSFHCDVPGRSPARSVFSETFLRFAEQNMPNCIREAARAQGFAGELTDIKVGHLGSYSHRRARGLPYWSMHATGRSLDLSSLSITMSNGQRHHIPMTLGGASRSATSKFYNTFNRCWQKANAARQGCGGRSAHGMLDCRYNADHHTHVHLSLPFCPRVRGIVGT